MLENPYLRLTESFCYLTLVMDVCSRHVVAYDLSLSLSIDDSLRALPMALKGVTDADDFESPGKKQI